MDSHGWLRSGCHALPDELEGKLGGRVREQHVASIADHGAERIEEGRQGERVSQPLRLDAPGRDEGERDV